MHPMFQNGQSRCLRQPFSWTRYMVQVVRQTTLKMTWLDRSEEGRFKSKNPQNHRYSYRRISTGRIREAARAGISVPAAQISKAAAEIQNASNAFG
jgi:hypothetical protein